MRGCVLGVLAVLSVVAASAGAETLGDIARARGVSPPEGLETADPHFRTYQVPGDARDLLVVYVVGERDAATLHVARWQRAARQWTAVPLDWHVAAGGPRALAVEHCRSGLAIDRSPGGFVVRAHINPSAECTIVLAPDLTVRAVLAGWPVVTLADGRIVYQRNQVHFAAVHPMALALFDPRRPAELALYPRKPYRPTRTAHIPRMRAVYTPDLDSAQNTPSGSDLFDERMNNDVVSDPTGDALAFVVAWDNTAGCT